MRNRGVDLSKKNGEIEVARRAAQEAAMREREAHKCVAAPSFPTYYLSILLFTYLQLAFKCTLLWQETYKMNMII